MSDNQVKNQLEANAAFPDNGFGYGMTYRQWLAGHILAAIVGSSDGAPSPGVPIDHHMKEVVFGALAWADIMIAAQSHVPPRQWRLW